MKSLRFRLTLLGGTLMMLAFTSVASAQASRTWVSGVGDDANPCSRTAPCKTFPGAYSKTAAGGEIDCLDPGGFGSLTIGKSITIDCDPSPGGVLAAGTNGIVINAAATDVIVLRNITFQGLLGGGNVNPPPGLNGISITAAKAVEIQDVVITGFAQSCLSISSGATISVSVDDSKFSNCGTTTANAIIVAGSNAKLTISRSLLFFSSGAGVLQAGGGSQALITNSTVGNTNAAFQSSAGNFLGASGNTVTNNTVVFNQNGGQIFTGGDNPAFGNGAMGATTAGFTKF